MADYKNIIGKPIKLVSTNLDNSQAEGQIWYNSTLGQFKDVITREAWASAANMLNNRRLMADFGTNTAAVAAGGDANPPSHLTASEHYNGTGWSSGGAMPQGMYNASGAGIETAGLSVGGNNPDGSRSDKTFEYNGTSWTNGGNLTEEREGGAAFGTETAGVACGGESLFPTPAGGVQQVNSTDEYNGTSWTAVNNMSNVRYFSASVGHTQTAGAVFGGPSPSGTNVELYDGTNWTAGGNTPSSQKNGQAASGVQTDAFLINAGDSTPTQTNDTSKYNGTTFTASVDTANTKSQIGAGKQAPSTSTAIAYGGLTPAPARVNTTEEYVQSINIVTAGAWASGGNMSDGRGTAGDCGTYLAGLVFGGNPISAPYTTNVTEEYNGSTWSNGGNVNHATSDLSGAGTQTAAACFGFSDSPTTITQHYDGSTWTTVPGTLPTGQGQARGIGTQTAALVCGKTPATFEYDGSSWTSGGAMNSPRTAQKPGGWGIQTAAIMASGYSSPPATIISNTETYNGTAWTETGHSVVKPIKRAAVTTAGTSSNGMLNGGGDQAGSNNSTAVTQLYNGTAWVTQPSLATARTNGQGFGTSANGVVCGGHAYPAGTVVNATEEFTAETTGVNVKTISTS